MSNSTTTALVEKLVRPNELRNASPAQLTFAIAGVCYALDQLTDAPLDSGAVGNLSVAAHLLSQALVVQV